MGMKCGIFEHRERRCDVPLEQLYRVERELVAQAEQAWFDDTMWQDAIIGLYAQPLTRRLACAPLCPAP
jgi:hypothetical protein